MKCLPAACRFLACLVSVLAWCGLTPPAPAQTSRPPFGQGTHAFRRILFDLKLQPLENVSDLDDAPHTLLIVLGDTTVLDQLPGGLGLKGFVEHGGAVLLATDRETPYRRLQRDFGFRVAGTSFRADPQWTEGYKNIPECPFLMGIRGADPDLLGELPAGQGFRLSRVATNRPSCLERRFRVPGLSVLAALPPGCVAQGGGAADPGIVTGRMFALGGEVGDGRLLVLADHSLFINDMMLQPDTDNIDFAYNCVEWLTQGKEARTRVLFVEEGEVNSAFDIPLKQVDVPLPPEEVLVPLVDEALSQVEQEDVFHKLLHDRFGDEPVVAALVLGLTALLAFYGLYRLSRSRHRVDLWAPLLEKVLAKQQPASSLLEQRHRAMLGQGNLWEPARALAQEMFAGMGIGGEAAGPPSVSVRGGWWRRWVVGRRVLRLWHIAHDSRPVRVSPAQFARLVHDLEELRAAQAAGTVRLEFPAPPAAPPRNVAVRHTSEVLKTSEV